MNATIIHFPTRRRRCQAAAFTCGALDTRGGVRRFTGLSELERKPFGHQYACGFYSVVTGLLGEVPAMHDTITTPNDLHRAAELADRNHARLAKWRGKYWWHLGRWPDGNLRAHALRAAAFDLAARIRRS